MNISRKVKKNDKRKIAFSTLVSGFLLHAIVGTFYTWPSIDKYFHSYLSEKNSTEISKVYLSNVFSLVIVFHNIFIFIGIYLNKYYSSTTITGFGLLLKLIANAFFIFTPNIKIVTLCILICSSGCGIAYMPIISEIWKYYPNNKGFATSFALSGFGLTQLLFEDVSIQIINSEKDNIDFINEIYSSYVNDSFKLYLKKSEIFFSILSIICIILIFPYDKYSDYWLNPGLANKYKSFHKSFKENNFIKNNLLNDKDEINAKEQKKNNNNCNKYNNINNTFLSKVKEQNKTKKKISLIKRLSSFFTNKKEKLAINNNKKYMKEDYSDNDYQNSTDVNLVHIDETKKEDIKETFLSLIASYPFLQLTFIFFFTMMFGIIEVSSIKNFGLLNGHSEEFLWICCFLWKTINFLCFPLCGFLFDKFGFKRFYRIIIFLEILISSICFYISYNKVGFLIYCIISAVVHSAGLAIRPTNFSIIFDDEKGVFLFGISCFLTNSCYIFRPLINNLLTHTIYYLLLYLIFTLFSMLGFIILCFFVDEKHSYNSVKDKNEYEYDMGEEMDDYNSFDNKDNDNDNNNLDEKNKNN